MANEYDVVVIGSGTGGYVAAIRAAQLGMRVACVEKEAALGGTCLNVGCIPSKALLHIARVISEIEDFKAHGINLGGIKADIRQVRVWAEKVVAKLTTGLAQMAKQRKVQVVRGTAEFTSPNTLAVTHASETTVISFDHAIIAAGSQPAKIPELPDDPRILDSTSALLLE